MGHFAEVDNENIVQRVIVIGNDILREPNVSFPDTEIIGQEFIRDVLGLDGEFKQTSFNGNFRGLYAGIGYRYDPDIDEFVVPESEPEA